MSKRNTTAKTVKFELDLKNPPVLTTTQRKRLTALATRPDSEIDYCDIPKQAAEVQWSRPGALVSAENKRQITLRLDVEVLNFFKNTGERYQSRINAVLREYVRKHAP
jgi:uncharacterized protein (DUF4415 family)